MPFALPPLTFSPTKIKHTHLGDGTGATFAPIYNGVSTPKEQRNRLILIFALVVVVGFFVVMRGLSK